MEGAFSQPNGQMCRQMLSWGRAVTAGSSAHDLLELYCGNANFTIPLAANFRSAAELMQRRQPQTRKPL